ncbi:MAG: dihydropteroate synthase [Candidatus Bipolaricaulota bacterium]|nr:MAG: dihydropteroate synthase [Candidatus Bipolaricaulota bacterium]
MLRIVGELINSTRSRVGSALAARDETFIRRLARDQHEAGADVIDLNAGGSTDRELEGLLWLIEIVEDELGTDACLGIDTSDPDVMEKAIAACSAAPMMNSISNEPSKLPLIEIAADRGCDVIGLAMGEKGMPKTADDRVAETAALLEKCTARGVDPERLYVDQICMSVASDTTQGRAALDAVRRVRDELAVKTLVAVSNVSFGLPGRRLLNRTYLALLVAAGLDGAILDPTDRELMATLCAARALVGVDEYCMGYIGHHRASQAREPST